MNRIDRSLKAFVGLRRLSAEVELAVRQDVSRYGLTVNEFAVLEALFHKGALPIQQIKASILVASSSTTYIVDKLCEKGLVERYQDKEDKRIIYAHLTKSGNELMQKSFPSHAERIAELFHSLSEEELETFHNLIKKITNYQKKTP